MPSVVIIGAGAAGLVAAKVLLDDNFIVTLFDRQNDIGGIWSKQYAYYDLHDQSSGGTLEFSDLHDGQEYCHWQRTHDYLKQYCNKFDLTKHIHLNTNVKSIYKGDNDEQWTVIVENINNNEIKIFSFDFIVIASGLLSHPCMPYFDGQEKFTGEILHVCDVKSNDQLENKTIVVVGGSKSAADIATSAATYGKQCYMIFRRIHWLTPCRLFGGKLHGKNIFRKITTFIFPPFPFVSNHLILFIHKHFSKLFEKIYSNMKDDVIQTNGFNSESDKIYIPKGSIINQHTGGMIPDNFCKLKNQGKIIGKLGCIKQIIDNKTICLDTGEYIEADMIICATGFIETFSFFTEKDKQRMGLPNTKSKRINLYRNIIPIGVSNIAFIGFTITYAPWMMMEVTAHWISDYFLNRLKLPSNNDMHTS
ncbi:unnamed protein product, partial [Didymodactylos carnosus]